MEIASNVAFAKDSHTTLFWKGTGFYIKTKDLSAHESSQTQISRFEKKGKDSIAETNKQPSFITLALSVLGRGGNSPHPPPYPFSLINQKHKV